MPCRDSAAEIILVIEEPPIDARDTLAFSGSDYGDNF
jgi:hypothetical protein